jgi:hypothetical protein
MKQRFSPKKITTWQAVLRALGLAEKFSGPYPAAQDTGKSALSLDNNFLSGAAHTEPPIQIGAELNRMTRRAPHT